MLICGIIILHIGILHPFQFAIDEENAHKIMEMYTYEWTDEQI